MVDPTDFQAVSRAVLEVISSRTGYPFESLDIAHSIEADLGCADFKWREIMGALRTLFPGVAEPEMEKLQTIRDVALWFFTGSPEDVPPPKPCVPPDPPGGVVLPLGTCSTAPPESAGVGADPNEDPVTNKLPPHPETLSSYRTAPTTRMPRPRPSDGQSGPSSNGSRPRVDS